MPFNATTSAASPPPSSSSFDFENFLQGWLNQQKNYYLEQLLRAQVDIQTKSHYELTTLVSQVLDHYHQYYQAKSIATHLDVFSMFAPPWFTPLEHSFLWISGFKPCLTFKILSNSVHDLSEDQLLRLEKLRAETRTAERELSKELARVQESFAVPPLVDLAGGTSFDAAAAADHKEDQVKAALGSVRNVMEGLVQSADYVRLTTAKKVVEILSPVQAVKFLTAATQLQLRIRSKGLQREAADHQMRSSS